jgi:hypothetical protein
VEAAADQHYSLDVPCGVYETGGYIWKNHRTSASRPEDISIGPEDVD